MSKGKGRAASNQRSNVKNPNNPAFVADRANRIQQGHPNTPATPPKTSAPDPQKAEAVGGSRSARHVGRPAPSFTPAASVSVATMTDREDAQRDDLIASTTFGTTDDTSRLARRSMVGFPGASQATNPFSGVFEATAWLSGASDAGPRPRRCSSDSGGWTRTTAWGLAGRLRISRRGSRGASILWILEIALAPASPGQPAPNPNIAIGRRCATLVVCKRSFRISRHCGARFSG